MADKAAVPLPPLQSAGLGVAVTATAAGSVIVTVVVPVQLFPSVAVIVYVPAGADNVLPVTVPPVLVKV